MADQNDNLTDAELAAEMSGQVATQPATGGLRSHELVDIARRYGVKSPNDLTQKQLDDIYANLPAVEDNTATVPLNQAPDIAAIPTKQQLADFMQPKVPPVSLANELSNAATYVKDWAMSPSEGQVQSSAPAKTPQAVAQVAPAQEDTTEVIQERIPAASELVKQAATPTAIEVQSSLETKLAPVRQQIADNEAQKMADSELQKYMQVEQERQLKIQNEAKALEDTINNEVKL